MKKSELREIIREEVLKEGINPRITHLYPDYKIDKLHLQPDFDEEILWMTFGRIEVSVPFKNLDKFIKTLNEIKKTSKKWGKG